MFNNNPNPNIYQIIQIFAPPGNQTRALSIVQNCRILRFNIYYSFYFDLQISLTNKTLSEVHQILQKSPQVTSLTIEYDVSIMESVKLATGPLLIEIERPCNEDLGLFLSNQRYNDDVYSSGSETYQRVGTYNAIYIDSILPASISDR